MAEIPTEVERLRAENKKLRKRNTELEVALAEAKAEVQYLRDYMQGDGQTCCSQKVNK